MIPPSTFSLSGFPGALPLTGPHHAVPAAERQGAPVDSSERGASDLSPAPGSGLLAATPGLLPGGHRDTAPLPSARGGVHRPKEPQVHHEAAVGDLGVRAVLLRAPSRWITLVEALWSTSIQSLFPQSVTWIFFFLRRAGTESSCFLIVTDAPISNCDQLNDCPDLDLNRCLDFFFVSVVKKREKKTFLNGTFSLFTSSFAVTTGLLYCADSTPVPHSRGITSYLSLPLSCVLKTDQVELSSDCNTGAPLPFGSLSVHHFL